MLAFLLQLSAEQSAWLSLAVVGALVLLLGLAGEYADYLSHRSSRGGKS